MNKYRKLIVNTLLMGLGTFSSKILVFLLMPLYTRVLSTADYGTVDLLVQMSNLMLPLVSAGILNAIIRFGLDRSSEKSDVFTTGLLVIFGGFAVFLLFSPLLSRVSATTGYTQLIYLYVLTSLLRSLCSQFVRAQERVRLYALDGVMATMTVIGFNALFLVVWRLGITGYMLATVASDFCSALFLFLYGRLWRFIRLRRGMGRLSREMIRYSVPLIPTTVFWWITNVSNRFIVTEMLGAGYNGLYAASYKVPTVVNLVSNIFIEAWQMSAVTDGEGKGRGEFFSNVLGAFQAVVFLCASGLILFSKFIMWLLVAESFYPAWEYVPILVMATAFSCLVSFLGSVYMVEKRSVLSLLTTMVGAGLNVLLSFILIPFFGVNGAAFAMFASYFIVFLLRAVTAQKMVKMKWNIPKLGCNIVILLLQSFIMIQELPLWILWEGLLTLLSVAINLRPILLQLGQMRKMRRHHP